MSESSFGVQVEGLRKSFGTNEVLKGIDLSVPKGTIVALLGPNGAGKTTMVRILTTLLQPDAGTVKVGGYDVLHQANAVRSIIGLTGQYAAVDDKLTGIANLEMIGQLYHLSAVDARQRARQLIERFELVDAAHRPVKTYSGGMRRRLDLAASLTISPPILFLDEPTTGLDPHSRITMWKIIEGLVAEGTTVLLTTQYLEEADRLANSIAVIDHGVVIARGTADELKRQIGGERLELTMQTSSDYERAESILGNMVSVRDAENRKINIEVGKAVSETTKVLTSLENAGVQVESFALHRPTLDDVFLKLTGHEADIEHSTEAKTS